VFLKVFRNVEKALVRKCEIEEKRRLARKHKALKRAW